MATVPPSLRQSRMSEGTTPAFSERQPSTIRLYPLSNYTFGVKNVQNEEDSSVAARLKRLEEYYEKHGMRRTSEAVLVCHEHNHPHVLMLQIKNAFFKLYGSSSIPSQEWEALANRKFSPGDYLPHEMDEIEGLKMRLNERLAPTGSLSTSARDETDWNVLDTISQWWRPNFETFMYPYLPPHVTRPKESKKLYFIELPEKKTLSVPQNMKLLAVPLFELYDNTQRYGPQLSAIPHYLSRYRWEFVDEKGDVVAWTPGAEVDSRVTTKVLAGGEDQDIKQENGEEAKDDSLSGLKNEAASVPEANT